MQRKRSEISRDLYDFLMDGYMSPELEQWLAASEENRRFVEELKREPGLLKRTAADMENDDLDTARAWSAVSRRIGSPRPRRTGIAAIRFGAIAAAAAIIAAAVLIPLAYNPSATDGRPVADLSATVVPEGITALIIADGTLVPLPAEGEMNIEVADGVEARYCDGTLTYPVGTKGNDGCNRIAVARGTMLDIFFSDGSHGRFNACSDATFPAVFSGEERRISLDGEALMRVRRDPEHPFVVETPSGASINVLGTTFDVSAYSERNSLEITLMEGKVEMSSGKITYMMEPGEHISCGVGPQGEFSATRGDTEAYSAWAHGNLVFNDMTLQDIMQHLTVYYDMEAVYLNDQVRTERFGFKLPRYDTPDPILNLMESTSDVRFKRTGRIVYVMNKNEKNLK